LLRRLVVPVLALGVLSACALLPVGWTGRQAGLTSAGAAPVGSDRLSGIENLEGTGYAVRLALSLLREQPLLPLAIAP
jgi:hypothetical protein